jgi:hypothetical protein
LPLPLYGWGNYSPTLREEHRQEGAEQIFGPKRKKKIWGGSKHSIMKSLMTIIIIKKCN